ncbi:hypothetical protein [Adlercreutzia caecimuris]|uniref:Uncharacterized protein n=1 Tax=Adlercreutzia caecimuris TaxID=671266 RepID=A0A4S4FW31_9ACTN|nr:hypothetical protein [Adlercreutzia caecimuris]THG34764.1 hypothetical protein E5986_11360 [Adlercreutzia caecimuris]
MRKIEDEGSLSRRDVVLAAAGLSLSCFAPTVAFAGEEAEEGKALSGEECVEVYADSTLSSEDMDLLLQVKAEQEAQRIIAEAEAAFDVENARASTTSRPTYSTVYGSPKPANTGSKEVAGQGRWGTRMEPGSGKGSIHAAFSGGGTMNVTVAFPTPFGSLGVSLPLPKKTTAALAGVSVTVPDDGHWYKMYLNAMYTVKPFVVYEKKNGKKSVYRRSCIRTFNGHSVARKKIK